MLFTRNFWVDAAERAVSTFAEVVLAIVAVLYPVAAITNKHEFDVLFMVMVESLWMILLAGLGGAVLSVLKCIVAATRAGTDTASLVKK